MVSTVASHQSFITLFTDFVNRVKWGSTDIKAETLSRINPSRDASVGPPLESGWELTGTSDPAKIASTTSRDRYFQITLGSADLSQETAVYAKGSARTRGLIRLGCEFLDY